MPVLFTSGALSDLVLFDTVVQHWLLAIDRDRIAVGLSFESPPIRTICLSAESYRPCKDVWISMQTVHRGSYRILRLDGGNCKVCIKTLLTYKDHIHLHFHLEGCVLWEVWHFEGEAYACN